METDVLKTDGDGVVVTRSEGAVRTLRINRPEAENRVRLSAILAAVATKENLEATDEEVDEEIRKGVYNQSEFANLKKRLLEDGTYADLRRHVIEEKAYELITAEAKITTK